MTAEAEGRTGEGPKRRTELTDYLIWGFKVQQASLKVTRISLGLPQGIYEPEDQKSSP